MEPLLAHGAQADAGDVVAKIDAEVKGGVARDLAFMTDSRFELAGRTGLDGLSIGRVANEIGSNLVIRPEVRYDYAQEGIFDGQNDQAHALT